jgi:hypothetical protein
MSLKYINGFLRYWIKFGPMNMKIKTSVKIILILLFLGCLLPMPYVYFQFVRAIGMIGFAWLAYMDSSKENKTLMIVWIGSALIINPIFKVSLGRALWNVVDVIWAVVLIISIFVDVKQNKK